jgi:hypothetical protein
MRRQPRRLSPRHGAIARAWRPRSSPAHRKAGGPTSVRFFSRLAPRPSSGNSRPRQLKRFRHRAAIVGPDVARVGASSSELANPADSHPPHPRLTSTCAPGHRSSPANPAFMPAACLANRSRLITGLGVPGRVAPSNHRGQHDVGPLTSGGLRLRHPPGLTPHRSPVCFTPNLTKCLSQGYGAQPTKATERTRCLAPWPRFGPRCAAL